MTDLSHLAVAALHRNPDRPAIEFAGAHYDWGDVAAVAGAVRRLLADSGIAATAPVAFVPRNRPAALATLLALLADGRTICMIYPFQSPAGMARDVVRLAPAALIADIDDLDTALRSALAAEGVATIALDGMTARAVPGLERAGPAAASRAGPSAPRIDILTSGTTGPPKQFALPYNLLAAHFVGGPDEIAVSAPPVLLFLPLGNISGVYATLPPLIAGTRIVLLERFSVAGWHDFVVRHRPVRSGLPPSFVQAVLDADIPRADLASIRTLGVGAAPLDPTVQRAFEDRYGIAVLPSYGATEFAGPVACMTAELHADWGRAKLGSVGRAMPGVSLRVVDPATGAALPAGQEGILEVIAPRIGPDWIRTADIALLDADGFLFHRGRADGAIMRGGFKILPETIERALTLHPAVAEAMVTGLDDPRLGQVPAAGIRLAPGQAPLEEAALKAHLRQHVLATHIPMRWLFRAELPRTPSLKPDRIALRALFG